MSTNSTNSSGSFQSNITLHTPLGLHLNSKYLLPANQNRIEELRVVDFSEIGLRPLLQLLDLAEHLVIGLLSIEFLGYPAPRRPELLEQHHNPLILEHIPLVVPQLRVEDITPTLPALQVAAIGYERGYC